MPNLVSLSRQITLLEAHLAETPEATLTRVECKWLLVQLRLALGLSEDE